MFMNRTIHYSFEAREIRIVRQRGRMCEIIVLLSYEPGTRSEIALYYVPRRVRFKIECSRLVPVPYFGVTNRKALLHGSLGFGSIFGLNTHFALGLRMAR